MAQNDGAHASAGSRRQEQGHDTIDIACDLGRSDGAVNSRQLHIALGDGMTFFNVNVAGNVHVYMGDAARREGFQQCRKLLLDYADEHKLRKSADGVYEPVQGCPWVYKKSMEFKQFINKVLKGNASYTEHPSRFRECLDFLRSYEGGQLPDMAVDRSLMSFSNGVLNLATGSFTSYASIGPGHPLAGKIARNHIPKPYTDDPATPQFDTL